MAPSSKITKVVTVDRFYSTPGRADLEARQYINHETSLQEATPKPKDWSITAKVVKAESYHGKGPHGKSVLRLHVEAFGTLTRITEWAENYRKIHGSFVVDGHESSQPSLKSAQQVALIKQAKYEEAQDHLVKAKALSEAGKEAEALEHHAKADVLMAEVKKKNDS